MENIYIYVKIMFGGEYQKTINLACDSQKVFDRKTRDIMAVCHFIL